MFDDLFYKISVYLFGQHPSINFILVFVLVTLALLLLFACTKIRRLLYATALFFGLTAVSFFPVFAFPSILDSLFLQLGLVTTWYVKSVPEVIRTPTLWFTALLFCTFMYFVVGCIKDIRQKVPLTWSGYKEYQFQISRNIELLERDEIRGTRTG